MEVSRLEVGLRGRIDGNFGQRDAALLKQLDLGAAEGEVTLGLVVVGHVGNSDELVGLLDALVDQTLLNHVLLQVVGGDQSQLLVLLEEELSYGVVLIQVILDSSVVVAN